MFNSTVYEITVTLEVSIVTQLFILSSILEKFRSTNDYRNRGIPFEVPYTHILEPRWTPAHIALVKSKGSGNYKIPKMNFSHRGSLISSRQQALTCED